MKGIIHIRVITVSIQLTMIVVENRDVQDLFNLVILTPDILIFAMMCGEVKEWQMKANNG